MKTGRQVLMGMSMLIAMPLCMLVVVGCSKPDADAPGSAGSPPSGGDKMAAPPGGGDKMAGGSAGGDKMSGAPGGDKMSGGSGRMGGGDKMSGGPGGGPGGRGGPVAESASGAEIYQAKCGCHGPDGKGKKAPALTGSSGDADAKLTAIIHDGKEKMPAFGSQLSDAQIKKVVTYIKEFKP